jgi:hypothetical protein
MHPDTPIPTGRTRPVPWPAKTHAGHSRGDTGAKTQAWDVPRLKSSHPCTFLDHPCAKINSITSLSLTMQN